MVKIEPTKIASGEASPKECSGELLGADAARGARIVVMRKTCVVTPEPGHNQRAAPAYKVVQSCLCSES
jgi:hypothetical protein